jgi:hypothetical protein
VQHLREEAFQACKTTIRCTVYRGVRRASRRVSVPRRAIAGVCTLRVGCIVRSYGSDLVTSAREAVASPNLRLTGKPTNHRRAHYHKVAGSRAGVVSAKQRCVTGLRAQAFGYITAYERGFLITRTNTTSHMNSNRNSMLIHIHSLSHSLTTHSLTHIFAHYPHTHSLTHLLAHSLTRVEA